MHVAPQIVVHVVHCFPLLSIVEHCYPLLLSTVDTTASRWCCHWNFLNTYVTTNVDENSADGWVSRLCGHLALFCEMWRL